MEKKHSAQLKQENKEMARHLQELKSMFAACSPMSKPGRSPPNMPPRRSIRIADESLGANGSGTNSGPSREENQVSSSTKVVCVDDSDDQGSLDEEFDDNGNVPNPTNQDNPIPHTTNNPV